MATKIQIDFPPAPKVAVSPERQAAFDEWVQQYNTCVLRALEELAAVVDQKKDSN